MVWQAIASAGLDFIGKKQEQRWAKQAANRQMDFQREMSNTAYQRAMADMKKAGINPIMVSKLGGASTPTGAMARTPDMGKMGSDAIKNYATAKQFALTDAQTKNTNELSKVHNTTAKANSAKAKMLEEQAITEALKQSTERAKYTNLRIKNSMDQFEFNYFKKLGYPPKVLTARVENIIGTHLWEKLPPNDKVAFTRFVYDQARKLGGKINEFTNNPDTMIDKWWKQWTAMNPLSLPSIYGGR